MIKFDKKNDKPVYEDGPMNKRHVRKRDYKDKEFLDRMREIKMIKQDPEWYYTHEDLTAPFAKIPFNRILGVRNKAYPAISVPSQTSPDSTRFVQESSYVAPGICAVNFIPTMGFSEAANSPLNVAANKNFAFMRRENAGSTNYTDSDLMMYYLSVVGLIPAIKHAIRALKVSAIYTPTSRYVPDLLVKAMGFSPTDLRNNFENYRGRLNRMIVKFNQFPVPADFKHIKRWEFLCDNVFMDRNSTKAQIYFYRPIAIPVFHDLGDESTEFGYVDYTYPWALESLVTPGIGREQSMSAFIDFELYLNYIDQALANLYNSTDIAIMAGDTLKAFSNVGVYSLPVVKEFEEILPVYSEMGIRQFHNTEFLPILTETSEAWVGQLESLRVSQELSQDLTNFVLKSTLIGPGTPGTMQKVGTMLLNIDKPNPDWKDVVELTRTKMSGQFRAGTEAGGHWGISIHFASEIYVSAWIYADAVVDNPQILVTSFVGNLAEYAELAQIISAFDWAPIYFDVEDSGVTPALGEIDNYTFLSGSDLSQLNEAIIQDLFGIG